MTYLTLRRPNGETISESADIQPQRGGICVELRRSNKRTPEG